MIRTPTAVLIVLTLCGTAVPRLALSQEPDTARFRVQIWGEVAAGFGVSVRSYAELRAELERGLPPRTSTEDAAAILRRTRALATRVRAARAHAKVGDIFTRDVRDAFRKMLRTQLDAETCAALFDDNPGAITVAINGAYPSHKPLSTMPANVLATLPPLPEDLEYRLAARQLLLLDTRAGLVIDRMPSAVLCRQGGVAS